MTIQEAIKILRTEHRGDSEKMEASKHFGALALERMTPEKPEGKVDEFGDRYLGCPSCSGPVTNYWAPGTKPKHCQFCGQALDWREEAEV